MVAVNEQTEAPEAPRADIDLDLTEVRSSITNLRVESISVATDLLAVLGPLPRALERAPDAGAQVIELIREPAPQAAARPSGADERPVLQLARVRDAERVVLDPS